MRKWQILLAVVAFAYLGLTATAQQQQPTTPDHMQHRFADPEQYAKSFDDPARDSWQMPSRVIDVLKMSPGTSVADIGAGTGYFTVRLAKAVPRGIVYAVDVEPSMLEHIRKRAAGEHLQNVVTVQASGVSPNVPKPVDIVIVVDTYHHLPNRPAYFRELRKSLATGGRVAIIDFRKDSPQGPPPQFRFEADQIIGEMKQAGYGLDARYDFLPRQHFLVFSPDTTAR
jgi:ubiquinone/menaquinone biosynthesis C-methylase UbiE